MKITFYQNNLTETQKENKTVKSADRSMNYTQKSVVREAANFMPGNGMEGLAGNGIEKGKSLIEIQSEAKNTNVAVQQDYMTVMSNTLSQEDYAKLQEEGFSFENLDPEEAVTIVDRIKAELVRAGKQIDGYTDDVSIAALTEILGSVAFANVLTQSFEQADVPMTKENIQSVENAWNMAKDLSSLQDGNIYYLLDNEMDSELWNLYLAKNSGAQQPIENKITFVKGDVEGYYAKKAPSTDWSELSEQIDEVIRKSGRELNDESREDSIWILDKGLPLTEDNLVRIEEIKFLTLPIEQEVFADAVAEAISNGVSPIHAKIGEPSGNIYEKAVRLEEYFNSDEMTAKVQNEVSARRLLEEIRLRMTAEVNVKLLKSGFSIDTAPMEELLDNLKKAEESLAKQYFPNDSQAVDKYQVWTKTDAAVKEFPQLPAEILGIMTGSTALMSFEEVHGIGVDRQRSYLDAGQSYEALMTAPRSDLGDSIKKAFANVDDILKDLGQEINEPNRRAVRILGYNRMEIQNENLSKVKEADIQVRTVIEKMTPAATLKMIRDGVNPLEKSFEELEDYFGKITPEYDQEAESYSRFLYNLERKNDITPEERDGYVGIFRLIRQIEKSDGAVVGALVNSQAQLQFSNLLTAVRSNKVKNMDVKIHDKFGLISETQSSQSSISEQITRAFASTTKEVLTEMSYSEEATKDYYREELENYRNAVRMSDVESVALLQKGQITASADNLLTVGNLLHNFENPFATKNKPKRAGEIWEKLDRAPEFEEAYEEMLTEAVAEIEEESFSQENTSLDVKTMQLAHKQLTMATAFSEQKEFWIPLYVDEKLTKVHLSINKSAEESGKVEIRLMDEDENNLTAVFGFSNRVLQGKITIDSQKEVMKTNRIADNFIKEAGENWNIGTINVSRMDTEDDFPGVGMDAEIENEEFYRVAKVFLTAVQKEEVSDEN